MLLMNGDIEVLEFDLDDMYLRVLDNDFLPFALKDYIQTTNPSNFRKSLKDIEVLRDYLSGRMLNLSRDNAKVILNVLSLPQTLKTEERLKIVIKCRGLSMTDNIWLKEDGEEVRFKDVCLRDVKLSDASYQISVLGKHISAQLEDLKCDLLTSGMFVKTWRRTNGTIELWKTDKTTGYVNTKAEIKVSQILDSLNVNHVKYREEYEDDRLFAVSDCFASDLLSFVSAQEMMDYCEHIGLNFLEFVESSFKTEFSNMTIVDYIIGNTDRHFENWGFMVNNHDNTIFCFALLFDHNQALLCDYFSTVVDDLIYEPTGELMFESALKAREFHSITLNTKSLTDGCRKRFMKLFPSHSVN